MKNNHGNNQNKRNHKTNRKHCARQPRHRNHAVLLKRTAFGSSHIVGQTQPSKSCAPPVKSSISKNSSKLKDSVQRKSRRPKEKTGTETQQKNLDCSNYKSTGEKEQSPISGDKARQPETSARWYNNPRLTGAIAAVLLFATLAIALIPASLKVQAEEQTETASVNPTMQLAKEYIYAGSRMLAIEDYGLSPVSTPTATPTPTITPTPTPTPVLKPDLVISNFAITPSSPTEGDQINFSVTVTNQGAGAMSGFLGVKYQIDGSCPSGGCPSHAVSSTNIAPNQSVTLNGASGSWTAIVGSHTLAAQVDDVGAIDESNETNNVATLSVNVSPAPTPTPTPTPAPAVPSIASVTQNADPTCLELL